MVHFLAALREARGAEETDLPRLANQLPFSVTVHSMACFTNSRAFRK